jgi:hypothetical protein
MTIVDPLTTPSEIEGHDSRRKAWQPQKESLDLLPHGAKRVVASPTVGLSAFSGAEPPMPGNNNGASTARPQRAPSKRTPGPGEPVVIPSINQGRRSMKALMHWEGVVDRVDGDEFHARLTPFENGIPNPARVEFTEFSVEDLANPDDRNFVEEGARFYWTIGRATNAAGTLTNVSLVRFRRLPPTTPHRRQLAEAEADALLQYGSEP